MPVMMSVYTNVPFQLMFVTVYAVKNVVHCVMLGNKESTNMFVLIGHEN